MMCLRAAGTQLFCSFCVLSAQRQIAVLTVQQPFLHLQDKSGLLCQINHNCHFIHVHHSTKLKPFCPYAFQIVINSQLYIHCLLWQLQSGNEWSGSLILVWVGSDARRQLLASFFCTAIVRLMSCALHHRGNAIISHFPFFCMVVVHVSTLSVSKCLKCISG